MAKRPRIAHQFKVFLSHGYKSPAANLYFWSILSQAADVQFEVDPAVMPDGRRKPTSVTRLEILIRNSDAFVGIFSFPEDGSAADLQEATAYFRLEADLAIRSRKPVLLFIDLRYDLWFRVPKGFHVEWFDAQEVEAPSVSPSRAKFEKVCAEFCAEVALHKSYLLGRREQIDRHATAIVVGSQDVDGPYTSATIDALCATLVRRRYREPVVVRFPVHGTPFQLCEFDTLKWCFVDVGKGLFGTGLVGYLHGRCVPMVRAFPTGGRAPETVAGYRSLYAGIEKGYDSDLIKWDSEPALLKGLEQRLDVIDLKPKLIRDADDARRYFQAATLRKDSVFLSYAGKDRDTALEVGRLLRQRFQTVFDYREKGSLVAGRDWPSQIEEAIEASAVGVQLVSDHYFASDHCKREARMMDARRLDHKMVLIPIKVQDGTIAGMPLSQTLDQYLRVKDYETTDALVRDIIKTIDKAA